jgi:predicted phage terminase large subunit-like protein
MMNRPVSLDGGYWTEEDIDIAEPEFFKNTIISVDPAVTTKRTSDFTGLAVLSRGSDGLIYVRHAEQVKYTSEDLKYRVTQLVAEYDARVVYVETNQGGDLWKQVFTGIAARYRSMRNQEKKEVRAAQAHDFYKKGRVKHTRHFPSLEEQMLAFPRVPHDDVLDAVTAGVLYFNKNSRKVSAYSFNYQEAS